MGGDDVGVDVMDVPPETAIDLAPDYPDAWDIPDLDISAEIIDSFVYSYTSTDSFPISIPDDVAAGVNSTLDVPETGSITAVGVYVAIRHPARGDLRVTITSPGGTGVRLHNHSGSSDDDILTFYPNLTSPVDPLSHLLDEEASGTWTLNVADDYAMQIGQLEDWALFLNL